MSDRDKTPEELSEEALQTARGGGVLQTPTGGFGKDAAVDIPASGMATGNQTAMTNGDTAGNGIFGMETGFGGVKAKR